MSAYYGYSGIPGRYHDSTDHEISVRCATADLSDDLYVAHMERILSGYPHLGAPHEPSQILGHLWLGSSANAENADRLKRYKITHVLNCAGYRGSLMRTRNRDRYPDHKTIERTQELEGIDDQYFNVVRLFSAAFSFIDEARQIGGRCLVFGPGVNLASAICIAYMIHCYYPLLQATKRVKDARRTTLSNVNFMRQLVLYARTKNCLDPDLRDIRTFSYGGILDRRRINSSHLPLDIIYSEK